MFDKTNGKAAFSSFGIRVGADGTLGCLERKEGLRNAS